MSKENLTILKSAVLSVVAIAVIYRVTAARDALTGDEKFLGIF